MRNFDQLLVTLKIVIKLGKLSYFRQKSIQLRFFHGCGFFLIALFNIQDIYVISKCTNFELNWAIRY